MQKKWNLIAAAALAVGGVGFTSNAWAQAQTGMDENQTTVDRDRDADEVATQGLHGTEAAPDAEGIRDVLASATEAALTEEGFNDLVERFVDFDRNRIGEAMPDDDQLATLHQTTKQIKEAWETKYGDELDIDDPELAYNNARIVQGEIGDNARIVNGQIMITGLDRTTPDYTDNDAVAQPAASEETDQDRNLEEGRNVAVVVLPAAQGLPEIRVPLIHEQPDAWRIDVPDNLDAATLQMNLQNQLAKVQQMQADWPADHNQAAGALTHHVLYAIFQNSPAVQKASDPMNPMQDHTMDNAQPRQQQPRTGGMSD